ncbi:hypothetical protein T552_03417 [Pneumocystis carinii B80]|uniref:Protein transport protein SFT2 n=1 Tax=Pneumocystis carinii (strain B80) TaxID=1408658 RepID=A0A0W4ZBT0_PNEC8|nr:hypothetical protein T552_03417 [Pneumocystis carinii B80]KTW25804.1 hypothetical protein T552_03417 [Pneumocystis carinii B80]
MIDRILSYPLFNKKYTEISSINNQDLESSTTDVQQYNKLSYTDRVIIFIICILSSVICFIFAIFFMITLFKPRKVILLWTIANLLFLTSFSILQGPWTYIKHLFSAPRFPFTCIYLGSMILTLYFILHVKSTILSIFSSIIQFIALLWYLISYFPMGYQGLHWGFRYVTTRIKSYFDA